MLGSRCVQKVYRTVMACAERERFEAQGLSSLFPDATPAEGLHGDGIPSGVEVQTRPDVSMWQGWRRTMQGSAGTRSNKRNTYFKSQDVAWPQVSLTAREHSLLANSTFASTCDYCVPDGDLCRDACIASLCTKWRQPGEPHEWLVGRTKRRQGLQRRLLRRELSVGIRASNS